MQTTKQLFLIICTIILIVPLCLSQPVRGSGGIGESGGDNPDAIDIHFPPCGNVANQLTEFRWSPKEQATLYTVELKETLADGSSKIIDTQNTINTAVLLDLPSLNLTIGQEYIIVVKSDNNKRSNDATITLKDVKDRQQVLLDLSIDKKYSLTNGVNKDLRKAELLRGKNWNLDALKSYNMKVDNLNDIIRVNDHFEAYVKNLFPRGADGCANN